MSDTVMGTLLGGGFALIGVFITLFFEARQKSAEDRRWYAEFFLQRKIDAISALYDTIMDCCNEIGAQVIRPVPTTEEYDRQLSPQYAKLQRAVALAWIYLDADTRNSIVHVRDILADSHKELRAATQNRAQQPNYPKELRKQRTELINEATNIAMNSLITALSPQMLLHYETTIKKLRSKKRE